MTEKTITISKLDAARRQLQTAIRLWFNEDDPVSIHALTYAAYEIIHRVSKERNPKRGDLLFDAGMVKQERRIEFVKALKKHASFFKHAETDGNAVIEFNPGLTEGFIFFALFGIQACGEQLTTVESAYFAWLTFHQPELLKDGLTKKTIEALPINKLAEIRNTPKREFLELFLEGRRMADTQRRPL